MAGWIIVLALAGLAAPGSDGLRAEVRALLEEMEEHPSRQDEVRAKLHAMGERILPHLAEFARSHDSISAFRVMARFRNKALPYIEAFLRSNDAGTRLRAAQMITWEHLEPGYVLLFEAYKREGDPDMRVVFLNCATDPLHRGQEKVTEVQIEFVRHVLKVSDGPDVGGALRLGLRFELPEVRSAALRALGSEDADTRGDALSALRSVGNTSDLGPIRAVARNDPEIEPRLHAAMVLAHLGEQDGREMLIAALRDPERGDIACRFVGEIPSEEWVAPLVKSWLSRTASQEPVLEALQACAGVSFLVYPSGSLDKFVKAWLDARRDRALREQMSSREKLRTLVKKSLQQIAEGGEYDSIVVPFVRLVIAGRDCREPIRKALEHVNPRVRVVAVRLLASWKDLAAIPALVEFVGKDAAEARFGYRIGRALSQTRKSLVYVVADEAHLALYRITGRDSCPDMGLRWRRDEVDKMDDAERHAWLASDWKRWLAKHPEARLKPR